LRDIMSSRMGQREAKWRARNPRTVLFPGDYNRWIMTREPLKPGSTRNVLREATAGMPYLYNPCSELRFSIPDPGFCYISRRKAASKRKLRRPPVYYFVGRSPA